MTDELAKKVQDEYARHLSAVSLLADERIQALKSEWRQLAVEDGPWKGSTLALEFRSLGAYPLVLVNSKPVALRTLPVIVRRALVDLHAITRGFTDGCPSDMTTIGD